MNKQAALISLLLSIIVSRPVFAEKQLDNSHAAANNTIQAGIDFGPFLADMNRRVRRIWSPPKGTENVTVVVLVDFGASGQAPDVRLRQSCGVTDADVAALNAVRSGARGLKLPPGAHYAMEFQFTFDKNTAAGGSGAAFVSQEKVKIDNVKTAIEQMHGFSMRFGPCIRDDGSPNPERIKRDEIAKVLRAGGAESVLSLARELKSPDLSMRKNAVFELLELGGVVSTDKNTAAGGSGAALVSPDKAQGTAPNNTIQAGVDFGPFLADINRQIRRTWSPPKGKETARVVVLFHLGASGEVSNVHLEHPSGFADADAAALSAVQSGSFRPLPAGAHGPVKFQFTFDKNTAAGGSSAALVSPDKAQEKVKTVTKIDIKAAVPALIEALNDTDYEVRLWSMAALGSLGPAAKEAIPALKQATKDKDEGIRGSAKATIVEIETGRTGLLRWP
jgi:TonB family protein